MDKETYSKYLFGGKIQSPEVTDKKAYDKHLIRTNVQSMDISAKAKKDLYLTLRGGIYNSLDKNYQKENGKGKKTIYFEDGTKQRVDTYKGRAIAKAKILVKENYGNINNIFLEFTPSIGKDYRGANRIDWDMVNYNRSLAKHKEKNNLNSPFVPKQESVKSIMKSVDRKSNELLKKYDSKFDSIKNELDKGLKEVFTKYNLPKSNLENKPSIFSGISSKIKKYFSKEELLIPENSSTEKSLLQKVARYVVSAGVGASIFIGASSIGMALASCGSTDQTKSYFPERNAAIVQTVSRENVPKKASLENKLKTPEVKIENKTLDQKLNSSLPSTNGSEYDNLSMDELIKAREDSSNKLKESLDSYEKDSKLLIQLLRELNQKEKEKLAKSKETVEYNPDEKFEFSVNLTGEELPRFDFVKKSGYIEDTAKQYLDHVNARNPNVSKDGISICPNRVGNHLVNNFVPLAEELSTADDLGYGHKILGERKTQVVEGLEKSWNGTTKLVSAGFWDGRTTEEKTDEGNQVLRTLKGVYDIPFGLTESVVSGLDFVAGGIVGKTITVGKELATGTVNSAVDLGNYSFAPIFWAGQELENSVFTSNGLINQRIYEISSVPLRFAGNVISHEAAQYGENIEIISKDDEAQKIKKGDVATFELASSLFFDGFGIANTFSGSSGSGTSIHHGSGFDWGNGSNVGGGK